MSLSASEYFCNPAQLKSFLGKFYWDVGESTSLETSKMIEQMVRGFSPLRYVFTYQKDDETRAAEIFQGL